MENKDKQKDGDTEMKKMLIWKMEINIEIDILRWKMEINGKIENRNGDAEIEN